MQKCVDSSFKSHMSVAHNIIEMVFKLVGNKRLFFRELINPVFLFGWENDWNVLNLLFSDELVNEKEKYKSISDELDVTFSELTGY